jgi:hypothetical protein
VAQDAAWAVHAGCAPLLAAWRAIGIRPELPPFKHTHSVANGYAVAIASAGCKTQFVKTFLQRRIAPDGEWEV